MKPTQMCLVAFDLDDTLLRGETVLEAIARPLGRLDRIREFELLTHRADIKMAREEVASSYEWHGLSELCSYLEPMIFGPGAQSAFRLLKRDDIKTAIMSINWEFAVEWFAQKLGAEFYMGTRLSANGTIGHFWPENKSKWLASLVHRLGIRTQEVAAVGDTLADVPMLRVVGHPFYVGTDIPDDLPERFHYPDGDIYEIAKGIVGIPGTSTA